MTRPVGPLLRWAGRLRFPYLLAVTATLFLVDLVVPDFVPLLDEILLGCLTLLFGSWKRGRDERRPGGPNPPG